jgi:hypothetical protein
LEAVACVYEFSIFSRALKAKQGAVFRVTLIALSQARLNVVSILG